VLDEQLKAEFVAQAKHSHYVVGPVGVEMDETFAGEDLAQSILGKVALLLAAIAIRLRIYKTLAHQGCRLCASSGKTSRVANRIRPIRHFHAAKDVAFAIPHSDIVDKISAAQFHVESLAAHQMAGTRHDIGEGNAACARLVQTVILGIDRIHCAHFRLDRCTAVSPLDLADMRVGIDNARGDHFACCIAHLCAFGQRDFRANGSDLAFVNDNCAILDRITFDRQDSGACKSNGPFLRSERCRARQSGRAGECA